MKSLIELAKYALEMGADGGSFLIYHAKTKTKLRIIASVGEGWDHVSVSTLHRCPTWEEMEFVKRLFFRPDETAMQLHVPEDRHINIHPNVLHLWRPHFVPIPTPPSYMV